MKKKLRILIGKHPCDDAPYIVGIDPDPRSDDFEPFRPSVESPGIDYGGWYEFEYDPNEALPPWGEDQP